MATVKIPIDVRSFIPASTNGARFKVANGTNFPVMSLAFSDAADTSIYATLLATGYGSGNLTLTLQWYADTATSGGVVWGGAIAAITPDTDTQDVETKAFATETTVTDTHLGTTGQRLHTCAITVSNLDSLAANDMLELRIRRIATDGSDTMSGDALLTAIELSYSDA